MKETTRKVWELGNFLTGAPLDWDMKIADAMRAKLNGTGLASGGARYGTVRIREGDPVVVEMVHESDPEINTTPVLQLANERVADGGSFARTWKRAAFILRTLGFDKIGPAVAELAGRVKALEEERQGIEDLENRISELERLLEEAEPMELPGALGNTQKLPGLSGNYVDTPEPEDTELGEDFEIVVRYRDGTELPLREACK